MRILSVRFKNLNSLAGEWYLDFTQPIFTDNGIFAITGPTGAGKTTILDAICLALYGRTPRLNRINKNGNEIMSRQTGECLAEVTFQTQRGNFRCHWSQHRAHNKANGELQPPRHEIVEADTGKVLENKLRDVSEQVEQVTGMDFDRFTRSMLLAQGGFAAFLQAPPDERAPILEQITGTEIYSRISIKVHEMRAESQRQLKDLQSEINVMHLLSSEEETNLHAELDARLDQEKALMRQVDILRKGRTWLEGIALLEKELITLQEQWRNFEQTYEAYQPEAVRLDRANQAASLEVPFVKLLSLREQQNKETRLQEETLKQLQITEQAVALTLKALQQAAGKKEEIGTAWEEEAHTVKLVRKIDFQLAEKASSMKTCEQSLKEGRVQSGELEQRMVETQELIQQSQADLKQVQCYLSENERDGDLVAHLAVISQMFETLKKGHTEYADIGRAQVEAASTADLAWDACSRIQSQQEEIKADLSRAEQQHQLLIDERAFLLGGYELSEWYSKLAAWKERQHLLQQASTAFEQIDANRQKRDQLLTAQQNFTAEKLRQDDAIKVCTDRKNEWEREVNHLGTQLELLKRIRSLEEERTHLEDGKPCPLCGSIEHPYVSGLPVMNQTELDFKEAQTELDRVTRELSACNIAQARTDKDLEQNHYDLEAVNSELDKLQQNCRAVMDKLQFTAPVEFLTQLQSELVRVEEQIKQTAALIAQIETKSKEFETAQKYLDQAQTDFNISEKNLQQSRYEWQMAEKEHQRLRQEYISNGQQLNIIKDKALKEAVGYGINGLPVAELDTILQELTRRRDLWLAKQEMQSKYEKDINAFNHNQEKHQLLLQKLEEELTEQQRVYNKLKIQYDDLTGERCNLYGYKDPEQEEERWTGLINNAGLEWDEARTAHTGAEQKYIQLQNQMAALTQSIKEHREILQKSEAQIQEMFKAAGFQNESDYQSACLTEGERKGLAEKAESLIKEKTRLETLLHDKTRLLKAEQEKNITDQPYDKLGEQLAEGERALKENQQQIGAVTKTLEENEMTYKEQQQLLEKIKVQKEDTIRWDNLHELIGSADGKKYRNFAQGLTFDVMIRHANRQLQKLSDRYLLVRDNLQPLELNVIDNYQAGEVRSTRNLSGGESFIVSLALALGLSHMASRKVRVDSLFLDEGFGTLDEEALDMALDTLAGLNQEGKLIGVISHIPALKERISTQIHVIPQVGGCSIITGAGLTHQSQM